MGGGTPERGRSHDAPHGTRGTAARLGRRRRRRCRGVRGGSGRGSRIVCPVEFGNPLCVAVLMEQKGPVHHHLREMLNREGAPLAYESCSGWHREPPLAARVGRAGATTVDKSRRAGHREAVGVTEMGWHAMKGASSARVKGGKKGSSTLHRISW